MYKLNSKLYLIFLKLNSIFLYNLSSKNIPCYVQWEDVEKISV